MSSTSFVFEPGAPISGTSAGAFPTAVPVTPPTSGATSVDWANILNRGVDVGAQLAAAALSRPKSGTVVVTSENAAAQTAAAGSRTGPAPAASSTPPWLWPVVGVVGGLSLLGILFGMLRK